MVSVLVREYDEAIAFYRDVLGFRVVEDTQLETKRWVRLSAGSVDLLLSRAVGEQTKYVGKQCGGRVFLFVHTTTFDADIERLKVVEGPRVESYGRVAVFEDLYGNRIDLIEPPSR